MTAGDALDPEDPVDFDLPIEKFEKNFKAKLEEKGLWSSLNSLTP